MPRPRTPRRYEGDWKDAGGGKGTVLRRAGAAWRKFEGDWSDGRMHGYGKYLYTDGGIYEESGSMVRCTDAVCTLQRQQV